MREVPIEGSTALSPRVPLRLVEVEPRLPSEVEPGREQFESL